MSDAVDTRRLVVAITEFLKNQLDERLDFAAEDRDSIRIAIECLELAYGLEERDPRQREVRRPLLEIFNQGTNPPSVKDKIQAEKLKNEGNEKMSQGLHEEALNCYNQAIELDRWNAIYYCNRAGSNIELERYYDALADCREALNLNPDYTKAFGRMGQTYALMERPERAARCYRQALVLEPDNERYRNNLQAAESLAAQAPQGEALIENLLSSLFGQGMPSGPSITIITEVTPVETNMSGEQSDQDNPPQPGNISSGTPMVNPLDSLMGLALPLMFGFMTGEHALSSDSSGSAGNYTSATIEQVVDELVENVSEGHPSVNEHDVNSLEVTPNTINRTDKENTTTNEHHMITKPQTSPSNIQTN